MHHLLRSRLELTDSDSVGCNADMAQRSSYLLAISFLFVFLSHKRWAMMTWDLLAIVIETSYLVLL